MRIVLPLRRPTEMAGSDVSECLPVCPVHDEIIESCLELILKLLGNGATVVCGFGYRARGSSGYP